MNFISRYSYHFYGIGVIYGTHYFGQKPVPAISNHLKSNSDRGIIWMEAFMMGTLWPMTIPFDMLEKYQSKCCTK